MKSKTTTERTPSTYESLDKRYVLEKDPNVEWLKSHGFREAIVHGVVDHYEYEILYQFKNEKKRIVLVCAYKDPHGWTAKAFQCINVFMNGNSVILSQSYNDVRDSLLQIEDDVDRMMTEIDENLGHEYSGLFMSL